MRKYLFILLFFSFWFLDGCAVTNNELYYWGNYSNTLYAYTKEPSPKTLNAHRKELLNIVKISEGQHKRVAPGIYAELGQLCLADGSKDQAVNYFQKELALYPESETLIVSGN